MGPLPAAPEGALSDIVIPAIFGGGILTTSDKDDDDDKEDPRVWVPQTDCLDFGPLCLCVSQGYYVNLLRFRGGGPSWAVTDRHSSPVHAPTLRGATWGYAEHDWHTPRPETYVF